jgi:hypothetical protein
LLRSFPSVLLLVSFPFLSYWNVNNGEAAFSSITFVKEAVLIHLSILVVIFLVAGLLSKFSRVRFAEIATALAMAFLLFFMFGSIHDPLISVFGKYESEWIIGYCLVFLFVITLVFYLLRFESFQSLVNIFSVVIVAITLLQIALSNFSGEDENKTVDEVTVVPKDTTSVYSVAELKALDRPNVYYIVADAYGGAAALKRFVDLDISDFVNAAKALNMYVADQAHSPYNLTFLTIAGILHADYQINEDSPAYKSRKPFYPGMMTRDPKPASISHFAGLGYAVNIFGNKWGKCYKNHVLCPPIPSRSLLSYEVHGFLSATPFSWYENKFGIRFLEPSPAVEVDAIGNLTAYLERSGTPKTPSVFFVHHLSPHPPYLFKADCSVRIPFKFDFKAWNVKSKPLFAANTHCTNKRILSFLDWVDANDPKAIIVITGDHGTAFKGIKTVNERTSTLTMARFPKRCQEGLSPFVNSINLMRMAMACVENKAPVLLENKIYLGSYKKTGIDAGKVKLVQP